MVLSEEEFAKRREKMVQSLIQGGVLRTQKCIRSMMTVKRHLFVWSGHEEHAYYDHPLPLGNTGQTISAPHMCAYMIEALNLEVGGTILEIGTGSGYHAALLAECVAPTNVAKERWGMVITIEYVEELYHLAKENLRRAGYSDRVSCLVGDGTLGVPPSEERELYDRVLVTAGAPSPPKPLLRQLKKGGMMVIPVGGRFYQQLERIVKLDEDRYETSTLMGCLFVPLLGQYGWREGGDR
ncbi:MAG: protein-L-isoaspartate(D-aspartate) O-methyltransferase [Candidatus Geothermarchaeales archaeon]